ncbi:hypothetical protein F4553_005267 [Allocatelliglobosispora scoriae]|uniref:Uncharacterized protein n=1 Tax=Allocatelliglobosispora scoriae TaxID=643052 RepID=A0A841BWM8_9ACTN|nr:hypothetical protein [Allocatelliglobosispora scoriae]MBB5871888.1 hypothetical protein [Allocatelliglobosispora scoriae]
MRRKWQRTLLAAGLLIAAVGGVPAPSAAAAGPVQITPGVPSQTVTVDNQVFFDQTFDIVVGADGLRVAGDAEGTAQVAVDDEIEVDIVRPDGTPAIFIRNYEFQPPSDPLDLSEYVQPGTNHLRVILRDTFGVVYGSTPLWFVGSVVAPPSPAELAGWTAGDVHVHSAGDTSLRDNLLCRNEHLIPADQPASPTQQQACARYLLTKVSAAAKANGLDWVILAEHGPWLGIYAPRRPTKQQIRDYSATEGASEWNTIADLATSEGKASQVRMLIGEELGTIGVTGHYSAYYSNGYVPNGPLDVNEIGYVRAVAAHDGWGGVNHPMTASSWNCWSCFAISPSMRAMEIYTAASSPSKALLDRWNRLLFEGQRVAAVGGGDVHTVKRPGLDGLSTAGRQEIGNVDKLGTDKRARTYTYTGGLQPLDSYTSRTINDPVRDALYNGQSIASNGPKIALALDGHEPSNTSLPFAADGHQLQISWDTASRFGAPTAVRIMVSEHNDPTYRQSDTCRFNQRQWVQFCSRTRTITPSTADQQAGSTRIDLTSATYPALATQHPARRAAFAPAAFVRVEVTFANGYSATSSPFYIDGTNAA